MTETSTLNAQDDFQLSNEERAILHDVGYDDETQRSATSILIDRQMRVAQSSHDDVVMMPLAEALRTFDFAQDLMFGQVLAEGNEDLLEISAHMDDPLGHFTWVRPGAKVALPVQSFTVLEMPQGRQFTHDITLIDEGADVEMISGATVPEFVHAGRHVCLSETYMRAGAQSRSVSIEHWGGNMEVRSYSYSQMEKGAHSSSTAISLGTVRDHQAFSHINLGEDAHSVSQSIVLALEGTTKRIDDEITLSARGARSESVTRMVAAGGTIINNAVLIGDAAETTGFLGCDGLKLTESGEIIAVPALRARAEAAQLSHEASVGMVSSEKLGYLMASGLDEDTARGLIVQGFLSLNSAYIPKTVQDRVTEMILQAKSGGM
ncbi:MAG: SufD family Fe-S cluster assembly protein [Pseudomonadota bacterium]